MRDKGMEIDEVADILETYPAKMNGVFTVGDLKYLSRTGRLSGSNCSRRQPFEYQTDPARKQRRVLLSSTRNAAEEKLR